MARTIARPPGAATGPVPGAGMAPMTPPDPDDERDRQPAPAEDRRLGGLARMSLRMARRIAIATIGATVVLLGLIMVLTPGPAIIVIPIGLSILALEFAWARRLLTRFQQQASRARDSYFKRRE